MSQWYKRINLVRIRPLIKRYCAEKKVSHIFLVFLLLWLKIRSRSPKSNQFFTVSQIYIHENLVRIQLLVHQKLCRQKSVMLMPTLTQMPTPKLTVSAPKTVCPPPQRWGDINKVRHYRFQKLGVITVLLSRAKEPPTFYTWPTLPSKKYWKICSFVNVNTSGVMTINSYSERQKQHQNTWNWPLQ